ncbi:MAG: hypothetical protein ABI625_11005 [bacterium]
MRSLAPRLLVACSAMIVMLSCGDVPTFADGIAYITPIELPWLVVSAGDTLRDTLGRAAPLHVRAFDTNNQPVDGITATYFVSPVDAGIHIDASGFLVASDSLRAVHLVARVGDRLQTVDAVLNVVPKPDQIVGAGTTEPLIGAVTKGALQVTVSGARGATRSPTQGVAVRYQIVAVNGNPAVDTTKIFLVDDATLPLFNDKARAIDTTDASGSATRYVIVADTAGVNSVEIRATARQLHSETIVGNPVKFLLPLKKTP